MIFLKNKDFILEFFMDVINVIDFLVNFELILVEEVWIFKYLVMYIVIKFVCFRNVFVFFVIDEVQNFFEYFDGRKVFDKLNREGCFNWVNIISGI